MARARYSADNNADMNFFDPDIVVSPMTRLLPFRSPVNPSTGTVTL